MSLINTTMLLCLVFTCKLDYMLEALALLYSTYDTVSRHDTNLEVHSFVNLFDIRILINEIKKFRGFVNSVVLTIC